MFIASCGRTRSDKCDKLNKSLESTNDFDAAIDVKMWLQLSHNRHSTVRSLNKQYFARIQSRFEDTSPLERTANLFLRRVLAYASNQVQIAHLRKPRQVGQRRLFDYQCPIVGAVKNGTLRRRPAPTDTPNINTNRDAAHTGEGTWTRRDIATGAAPWPRPPENQRSRRAGKRKRDKGRHRDSRRQRA